MLLQHRRTGPNWEQSWTLDAVVCTSSPSLHPSSLITRTTFLPTNSVFNPDILDDSKCFAAPWQHFPSLLPGLFSQVFLPLL